MMLLRASDVTTRAMHRCPQMGAPSWKIDNLRKLDLCKLGVLVANLITCEPWTDA